MAQRALMKFPHSLRRFGGFFATMQSHAESTLPSHAAPGPAVKLQALLLHSHNAAPTPCPATTTTIDLQCCRLLLCKADLSKYQNSSFPLVCSGYICFFLQQTKNFLLIFFFPPLQQIKTKLICSNCSQQTYCRHLLTFCYSSGS